MNHRTLRELIYSQLRLATSLFLHGLPIILLVDVEGFEPTTSAV